ncbi:hypothetical protein G4B88_001031 [Cannabis sativa]|uniref:NB-ARC domain-containing protein n=1 Tax=Cannabis sativa TaxID=3483 RepID=A0A7J6FBP5_CANSA|nr:hypothetical protein G4B88_001031 [Cannabis sativa]
MEGVIEEYLLDKLKRSRDGKESSNSSKISMHSKFRHIHNSLEKLLSLSSTQPVRQQGQSLFKEKLYILNDFDEPLLLRSALPRAKNNSYGFEEHLATLERLVVQQKSDEDDEFKAIAIVKTKGIGKTSLCTIVFDNEKVKKRFLPRVWVSMPTPSDEIQKEPQESDSQTYLILARSGRRESRPKRAHLCSSPIIGEEEVFDRVGPFGFGTWISKRLWRNSDSDENYRDLDLGINDHDWKTNNYRTAHALGLVMEIKRRVDRTIFSKNELSIPVIPLEKLGCNMRTESRLQASILLKEIESQFQSIENTLGNSRACSVYLLGDGIRRPICEIDDLRQQRGPDLGSRRLRNESGCQSIIMGD